MNVPLVLALSALGLAAAVSGALAVAHRARRRRAYREKVGLDLAGLVALLPAHLRTRPYTRFVVAPTEVRGISVGLVYEDDVRNVGNPPNVGLDFDAETGALVAIHQDGIGLGYK